MTLLLVYATVSIFFSFLCSILEAVLLSVTPTHINLKKKEGFGYAKILEDLKKDVEQMDTSDIYFDVGYMSSLCVAIDKVELGQKIHDKFALK